MLEKRYRWIATGDTYRQRERLLNWAWFYVGYDCDDKSTWAADHITDENDPCLDIIRRQPGVKVEKTNIEV